MTIAVKILDRALKEDFGFNHLLWVYSGRRGVHCWVCDTKARDLSQEARIAIAEYLTLIKGGEQQVRKVNLKKPIHPSVMASVEIINEYFQDIVNEQGYLETPEQWRKVLQLIPLRSLREELDQEFSENKMKSSWQRWGRIENEIRKKKMDKYPCLIEEMRLQYAYPRLDVNVTKGINHLLKSPLCVHPKTGRLCVPIDINNIDEFDPFQVPTVSQVCIEFERNGINSTDKKGYKHTSLATHMEYFDKFIRKLKKSLSLERRDATGGELDF